MSDLQNVCLSFHHWCNLNVYLGYAQTTHSGFYRSGDGSELDKAIALLG